MTGAFEEKGHLHMQEFFEWGVDQLPKDRQQALKDGWAMRGATWTLGSMCSGTDAPILVARAFAAVMGRITGSATLPQHLFSVELSHRKREFLARMFEGEVERLYKDVVEIGDHAEVPDFLRGGELSTVPGVQALFAGFPCQDVSMYNPKAAHNRFVVQQASARTGAVFHGIVKYARRCKGQGQGLNSVLLENVCGLQAAPKDESGSSVDPDTGEPYHNNLDFCIQQLEMENMWTFVAHLRPPLLGVPVRRDRLYILGIPLESFEKSSLTPMQATTMAQEILDSLCVSTTRDLDDYLLPEDHPAIMQMKAAAATLDGPRAPLRRGSWAESHARQMEEQGLDWWVSPIPSNDILDLYPALKLLTYRQFDLLRLRGITFPDREGRSIDVSQAAARSRVRAKTLFAIVTPTSSIYLGSRCRTAHGLEDLALQNIHYGDRQCRLSEFPESLLRDLAGNAWETTCASAMLLVQEVILGALAAQPKADYPSSSSVVGSTAATSTSSASILSSPSGLEQHLQPRANRASPRRALAMRRGSSLDLHFAGNGGNDLTSDLDSFLEWDAPSAGG